MKKLSSFNTFNFAAFAKDKDFQVTGVSKWLDFDTREELGTKVSTAITRDDTPYPQKDSEQVSNLYEKIDFKVSKGSTQVKIGDYVEPVNAVATVYGDFRNQLSVKCDDIKVVQRSSQTQQTTSPTPPTPTQATKAMPTKTL